MAEFEAKYLRYDAGRRLDKRRFGNTRALGHTQYVVRTPSLEL